MNSISLALKPNSGSGQFVFDDFGISGTPAAFRTTRIGFAPQLAGTFMFNRGVNMMRGKLIVGT